MKSAAIANGDNADQDQYNNLRQDAQGAATLLATQQSSPNMTLLVQAGTVFFGTTKVEYAGGNSGSFTAPATNPRIDLLYLNSSGSLVILQGTEAGSPVAPAYPSNAVPICEVYLRVGTTAIHDTDQATHGYIYKDVRSFIAAPSNGGTFTMPEKTGIDISAGEGVFIDSAGDAIKAFVLKTLVQTDEVFIPTQEPEASTSPVDNLSYVWLSDRRFAWAARYNRATTYYLYTGIGEINPQTGAINLFDSTDVTSSSINTFTGKITKISSTKWLVQNDASNTNPVLYCCSIDDDNVITVGASLTLSTNMELVDGSVITDYIEDDKFIITRRRDTNDDCEVTIGTVSGTTITVDTANWQIVDTGVCYYMWVKALSNTQAIISWNDGTNLEARICNYGTGTGNTVITLGSGTTTIAAIANIQGQIERISDTSFIIAWRVSASSLLRAVAGTINTNTITLGSNFDFRTSTSGAVAGICPYGKNGVAILSYDDSGSATYDTQIHYLNVNGTTVTCPMFTRISKVNGPLVQTVLTKTTVARSIAFVAGHLLTSLATGTTAEGTLGGLAKSFKASIEEVFMGVAEANSISNVVSVIPRGRSGAIYSGLTFKVGSPSSTFTVVNPLVKLLTKSITISSTACAL